MKENIYVIDLGDNYTISYTDDGKTNTLNLLNLDLELERISFMPFVEDNCFDNEEFDNKELAKFLESEWHDY